MNTFQKNIESGRYKSVSQFAGDMELMVANARTYNDDAALIVQWADQLLVCVWWDGIFESVCLICPK